MLPNARHARITACAGRTQAHDLSLEPSAWWVYIGGRYPRDGHGVNGQVRRAGSNRPELRRSELQLLFAAKQLLFATKR